MIIISVDLHGFGKFGLLGYLLLALNYASDDISCFFWMELKYGSDRGRYVVAGRVSPVHRGTAAARQGVLLHVVQPAGGQTQILQETRETHVHGRGTAGQRRTAGTPTYLLTYLQADRFVERRVAISSSAYIHNTFLWVAM